MQIKNVNKKFILLNFCSKLEKIYQNSVTILMIERLYSHIFYKNFFEERN